MMQGGAGDKGLFPHCFTLAKRSSLVVAFHCLRIYLFNQERKVDMFEKKKLWMVLATAALVAACGGGSGGGSSGGGGGGGGGGNGDGNGNGDPSGDTTLQSYLDMHPDQIIVNMLLPLSAYENTDAANGGLFGQAKGSDGNGAP